MALVDDVSPVALLLIADHTMTCGFDGVVVDVLADAECGVYGTGDIARGEGRVGFGDVTDKEGSMVGEDDGVVTGDDEGVESGGVVLLMECDNVGNELDSGCGGKVVGGGPRGNGELAYITGGERSRFTMVRVVDCAGGELDSVLLPTSAE